MKQAKIEGMVNVPTPIALPDDIVEVLNYRCRPAVWEQGVVRETTSSWSRSDTGAQSIRHSYRVCLDRRTKPNRKSSAGYVFVYVGKEGIRLVKGKEFKKRVTKK